MISNHSSFVPDTLSDLAGIVEILQYRRAAGTGSHRRFMSTVLEPVFGPPDAHGNFILAVGKDLCIAFMAHHDSVEVATGRVGLQVGEDLIIHLSPEDTTSRCLGADDGAGIWPILEMIRRRMPGLYIIFADEETGCVGSSALAHTCPDLFDGITTAISLDRHAADGNQVITQMSGCKTASGDFATALCATLGLGYVPSDKGGSTDSRKFLGVGDVRHATNISVAYWRHHTRQETLDFAALRRLRDRLVSADFSDLRTISPV